MSNDPIRVRLDDLKAVWEKAWDDRVCPRLEPLWTPTAAPVPVRELRQVSVAVRAVDRRLLLGPRFPR
jgi:hypothetical protein